MLTNLGRGGSLNDVAVFVSVVESGSFTAAAQRLSLSKSVVSKYVTRLEDRLGARLLIRTTRRLNLTEAGRVFYERSRRGLETIDDAQEAVSLLQGEPRGTLRVSSPMSFGVLHVAPAIPEFMARYPEVAVDMSLDDRKVDIVAEGFDISVRIASQIDPGLVARRIGPCKQVVVASPGYLRRNAPPRTPRDLVDHNVITYQYQHSPWEWEFCRPGGAPVTVPVTGRLQLNNSLAIREAVLGGAGISRTPTFVVGHDLQQGRLRAILTDYELPELSIYLVFAQRQHLAPKIRAFIEFMAGRFGDTPVWDRGFDAGSAEQS